MRDDRDGLDAAFAALIAALAAFTWVALLLAELGGFTRLGLLGLAAPAALAAGWRAHRSTHRTAAATGRDAAVLVVLLLACGLWLGRPAEPLLDGSDASAYLAAGRSLARHGALVYREPLLDLIARDDWDAVLDRELHPPRVLNLFPGSMQVVPGIPEVRPGFFHLNTVWIGAAESIAGGRAAYFVPWLAGMLALTAFWFLARRLASTAMATLGAVVLAGNVAFHWFSRVTMAEMPAAALILAGLSFAVRLAQPGTATAALLAGGCFGLAAFARVDVLLFVIPVVAGYAAILAIEHPERREWRWLAAALAVLVLHAVIHASTIAGLYADRVAYHMLRARSVSTASRVIPPVLVAVGLAAWLLSRRGGGRWAARAVWALFVLGVLAAFVRIGPQWVAGAMPLLLTPAGTVLAAAGIGLWLARDRTSPALLIAGLWITSLLVYAESARDFGVVPWTLRRYVPVVLPISVLGITMLADWLWRRGALWRGASAALMLCLTAMFVLRGIGVTQGGALAGVHGQMDRVAGALPSDAVVVTDLTAPSHFGAGLYGTFGRSVLFVSPADATAGVLRSLASRLEAQGRPLFVAVAPEANDARGLAAADLVGLELAPPQVETLRITTFAPAVDRLPQSTVAVDRRIALHRARLRPAVVVPATFEIGENDLTLRGSGFHGVELMGSAYARWTDLTPATLYLPRLAPLTGARLLLRLAGPRPAGIDAPRVSVALGGRTVGEVGPATPGLAVHALPLPAWALDAMTSRATVLSLQAPTFSPADSGADDRRQLGVAIDWVRVEPVAPPHGAQRLP